MDNKGSSLIGLTGGIASGKSKVALLMSQRSDFVSLDADQIARDLFSTPGHALDGLRGIIAGRFFLPNDQLDRRLFREAIFSDDGLRNAVDRYSHPLIWDQLQKKIKSCHGSGVRKIIVEVPLLFEAGWQDYFQKIVVVYAAYDTSIYRLVRRDSVTYAEAKLAYETQLSLPEKVLLADHVIDNSRSWTDTILQVNRLCRVLSRKNT